MVRVVNTCKKNCFFGSSLETLHTSIAPEWFCCDTWSIFHVGLCLAVARRLKDPKMGHTFYYPIVKSSFFSICKRQTYKGYLICQERRWRLCADVYFLWLGLVMARLLNGALRDSWDLEFFCKTWKKFFLLKSFVTSRATAKMELWDFLTHQSTWYSLKPVGLRTFANVLNKRFHVITSWVIGFTLARFRSYTLCIPTCSVICKLQKSRCLRQLLFLPSTN